MKHTCTPSVRTVRLFVLAAALSLGVAQADDYSDVGQLVRAGKLVEAQVRVDRHLAAKPRDPQMRFLKGVIQREAGRLPDAITTFTKLTEDHPELPEPYNNLAVIYAGQGQFDKARSTLEMAMRTNPSYATAHENLGDVYAKLASQAYNKALQIDNNTAAAPKLALIRELFQPAGAGQATTALAPTAPPAAAVPAAVAPPAARVAAPAIKPPAPPPPAPTPTQAAATVATAPAASSAAPAAPPKAAATPPLAALADGPTAEVQAAVRAWAKAWADKDMNGYLGAYGQEFSPPGQLSRAAWEQERRLRITGKARISLHLLNLSVSISGSRAVAKFQQDYKADSLVLLSRKTLELVKTGERWMIVKEISGT